MLKGDLAYQTVAGYKRLINTAWLDQVSQVGCCNSPFVLSRAYQKGACVSDGAAGACSDSVSFEARNAMGLDTDKRCGEGVATAFAESGDEATATSGCCSAH